MPSSRVKITAADKAQSEPDDDPFGLAKCARKVDAAVVNWRANHVDPRGLAPDSKQVTSLTLFIEAAEQLAESAFFGEDDKCVLRCEGEPDNFRVTGATFGSPIVRKSVLAPFRRIWMNDEDSNFHTVCGVIQKYGTNEPRVACAAGQRALFNHNMQHSAIRGDAITNKGLIELWLYTQFAHGGKPDERKCLDALISKYGKSVVEFGFRHGLKTAGAHFLILLRECVLPEFRVWREQLGIQPAFVTMDAFGRDGRTELGNEVILRSRGGALADNETIEQTFSRLIERDRFSALKTELFRMFNLDSCSRVKGDQWMRISGACAAIEKFTTLVDLISSKGFIIAPSDYIARRETAHHEFLDKQGSRRGQVQWFEPDAVMFTDAALDLLQELYAEFRTALQKSRG